MKYLILFLFLFFSGSVFAQDVFFSEYIEGSSSNKALEIYNGSGDVVDLSRYRVVRANNGSQTWTDSLFLNGSLAAGEVYVIGNPSADPAILTLSDTTHTMTFYNGDDAVHLEKDVEGMWVTQDVIGVLGEDPGSAWDVGGFAEGTNEQTLVRKNSVTQGNTDWVAASGTNAKNGEWTILPSNHFDNLGSHVVGGYLNVSIRELQYVTNPDSSDNSIFFGDTVTVQGLVMNGPADLWVGARWAVYVVDPGDFPNPWSGFFIIQHDTLAIGTNFGFVEPGMIVNFTGVVDEFGSFSQLALVTDPVIPIEIISASNPLPDPVKLTSADLQDVASGEKWESMFVTIENASIINNSISGNWASMSDGTGTTYIAEYFNWFRDRLNAGTYSWPSNGTNLNITGFIRDESGTPGRVHNINPRDTLDLTISSNPPVISGVSRNPNIPTSSDAVVVSAEVIDNTTVQSAILHYSINNGTFIQLAMSEAITDTFSAAIPAGADGDFVRYFVSASDSEGDGSILPGDTSLVSGGVFFYNVRDNGLLITDVQSTHGYANDASGYLGSEVTLTGIVMTDSTDRIGDYYIQDAAAAWSGMWINDGVFTHAKGDEITVTGTVEENFGITRLNNITSSVVKTAAVGEFDAVSVTTAEISNGGINQEAYESVFVRISNLTVTNPFPDAPSNFGEFTVSDGTGDLRIDDAFSAFSGQGNDTTYALDLHIDDIYGMGYFSFGNAKLIPRDSNDVSLVTSIEKREFFPNKFSLDQNFPNPFNPKTTIKYQIAAHSNVKFVIYDAVGREVQKIVNQAQSPGEYTIQLDASSLSSGIYFYRLEAKGFSQTRKMLLIK